MTFIGVIGILVIFAQSVAFHCFRLRFALGESILHIKDTFWSVFAFVCYSSQHLGPSVLDGLHQVLSLNFG